MDPTPPRPPFFYGHSRNTLDKKNRIVIPAKWRQEALDELFVIPHPRHECLLLMPAEEFRAAGERVRASSLTAQQINVFLRHFYSFAERCVPDKHGRLLLPDQQCRAAQLNGEVVLVGAERHIEIWDPARWERAIETGTPTYQLAAETAK